MAIITFSREHGSLGTQIAEEIVKTLNYRCLDKEKIFDYLTKYGFTPKDIDKIDTMRHSLLDMFVLDRTRYYHFMRMVVSDFAQQGNCVILGMGSQLFLKNIPGALHITLRAPECTRIERIKNQYACDTEHAEQIMVESDNYLSGLYKFFFNQDWDSQKNADIVINTEKISVEGAVGMIKDAALNLKTDTDYDALKDLLISEDVTINILYKNDIPAESIIVSAQKGNVTIKGCVWDMDDIKRCEDIASTVPDVNSVTNNLVYIGERGRE